MYDLTTKHTSKLWAAHSGAYSQIIVGVLCYKKQREMASDSTINT